VQRFEAELLDYVRTRHADLVLTIREKGVLPEGDALADAVTAFKQGFQTSAAGE